MQVFVAVYEHRHGTDIRVFAKAELAEAWRIELANEYWLDQRDGSKPIDPSAMADQYWEASAEAGAEFFNYQPYQVEDK